MHSNIRKQSSRFRCIILCRNYFYDNRSVFFIESRIHLCIACRKFSYATREHSNRNNFNDIRNRDGVEE